MPNSTSQLYQMFVQERVYLRGVTPTTKAYYEFAWKALAPYMPPTPGELSKAHVMDAIKDLKCRHADNSINGYLRALRAFVRWLQTEGTHGVDPKLVIQQMKTAQPIIRTLTGENVSRMLTVNARSLDERRVQAMLTFALDTGIRIAELLSLRTSDIKMDDLLFKVMGKGRKERWVPFSPEGRKRLWDWLKHRPASNEDWLWSTKRGTCITKRNSYRDLKALAKKCGVEGVRVSWHTLRHTFATEYIKNGGNVLYLQSILGHTDLKMTRRYVTIAPDSVSAVHGGLSCVQRSGKKSV